MIVTRFAPSPTGPLHLGHAFSALLAHDRARAAAGSFLLRIEDIDQARSRPEWEALIFEDLHWLGLDWPVPVMRQSERLPAYAGALAQLADLGLTYPCTCSRADIRAALAAPQEGVPITGPDGPVYPGNCRGTPHGPEEAAIRLDMTRAMERVGSFAPLTFTEVGTGYAGEHSLDPAGMVEEIGDIVLARAGLGTSYHLAVTVDDAAQGITEVVRGEDLFEATRIHRLLQALLGLPTPRYHHHRLIRDPKGKRLAKRDDARAIRLYRQEGATPDDIHRMVGLDAR